jgi:two-component system, OmpR family, sensor kinase
MTTRASKLRRLRLMVTLAWTAVLAVAVGAFAHFTIERGHRDLDDQMYQSAQLQLGNVFHQLRVDGSKTTDSLTWFVDVGQRYSEKFIEDTDIEPPLFRVTQTAIDSEYGDSWEEFTTGGVTFLAYARAVNDTQGYLTLIDRGYWNDLKDALTRRWWLNALGTVVAGAVLGWFIAGRAMKPAREAMTDQQGFLADAAHELRTPLSVILASASQALSRTREPAEYVQSLVEIRQAAERSAAGVTNLLDAARFEAGQLVPRLSPVRLDLLAEEVAASVRVDDVTITAEAASPVIISADMALLRQAIDNIVRNAAGRAATVRLVVADRGRDGELAVIDDGPGFDAAIVDHVFDRYRRGDGRGNAGLGLAIVRSIVLAHGGEVTAGNQSSGGASVSLRIPKARDV